MRMFESLQGSFDALFLLIYCIRLSYHISLLINMYIMETVFTVAQNINTITPPQRPQNAFPTRRIFLIVGKLNLPKAVQNSHNLGERNVP